MNLRSISIWTTGVMLIVTVAVPTLLIFGITLGHHIRMIEAEFAVLLWFASSTPLLISYFVSRNLQYALSTLILLFSTIVYSIAYAWVLYLAFFIDGMMLILLLYIGVASLSVMIPAWITALVIEIRHRKKQTEP